MFVYRGRGGLVYNAENRYATLKMCVRKAVAGKNGNGREGI
jgi:hypothetical protein